MESAALPELVRFGSWSFEVDLRSGIIRRLCLGDSEVAFSLAVCEKEGGLPVHADQVEVSTNENDGVLEGGVVFKSGGTDLAHLKFKIVDKGGVSFELEGDAYFLASELPSVGGSPQPHRIVGGGGDAVPIEPGVWAKEASYVPCEKLEIAASPFAKVELAGQAGEMKVRDLRSTGRPVLNVTGGNKLEFQLVGPPRKILAINLGRDPQISITTSKVFQKPSIGLRLVGLENTTGGVSGGNLELRCLDHVSVSAALPASASEAITGSAEGVRVQLELNAGNQTESPNSQLASFCNVALCQIRAPSLEEAGKIRARVREQHASALFAFDADSEALFSITTPSVESGWLPTCRWSFANLDEADLLASYGMFDELDRKLAAMNAPSVVMSPIELPDDDSPAMGAWLLGVIARAAVMGRVHSITFDAATKAKPEALQPLSLILEWMGGYERVHPSPCTLPRDVASLCLVDSANRMRLIVSNLTIRPQSLRVKSGSGRANVVFSHDANTSSEIEARGGKLHLDLDAWQVARIDLASR